MEVGKDSKFTLGDETAVSVVVSIGMVVGLWYSLQNDIEEAKITRARGITNGV